MSIKTRGCNIYIDGVTGLTGEFDVEASRLGDFVQPASFGNQYAIFPPGFSTPLVFVYHKDNRTTLEHQFGKEVADGELYNIDVIVAGKDQTVLNVMPSTNSEPFWDATKPEYSVVDFTTKDQTCKIQQLGVLVYTWTVQETLDPKTTYRLRLTKNHEQHLSGPFRLEAGEVGGFDRRLFVENRLRWSFGVLLLTFVLFVGCRLVLRMIQRRRRGYVRIPAA